MRSHMKIVFRGTDYLYGVFWPTTIQLIKNTEPMCQQSAKDHNPGNPSRFKAIP